MSEEPTRILLVEDEAAHAELVRRAFEGRHPPVRLDIVDTLAAARTQLADPARPPHLIIADWRLPDGEGIELLTARATPLAMPVIIMTSHGNERVAVEAMKAGALDYVVKSDASLLDMPHLAERALREWQILGERQRMAAALQDSEERLRLAFEAARIGTWNWNIQTDQVTWSDNVAPLFGLPPGQFHGSYEAYLNLIYTADVNAVVHAIGASLIGQNQKYRIEHRVAWPAGALHWLEGMGQVYHDEQGRPLRMTGTVADITDRKLAEEALRQQSDRLNVLHEIDQAILAAHSSEAIVQATLSRLGRLVPNRRMGVILFDFAADEAVVVAAFTEGKIGHIGQRFPLCDFEIAPALRQGRAHVVNDLTSLAAPSAIEQRMLANGVRAYVDVPLVVGSQLIGALSLDACEPGTFHVELIEIAREVADQLAIAIQQSRLLAEAQRHAAELEQRVADRTRELTAANEQLAAANESLAELDRLKSKFVSDVSHELRTPIANLKLYADLLERGQPEKQGHYRAVLKQQTQRLSQLVEDILDLSRLEIARQHVLFGPVDLTAVIDQVVTAHQPRAEAAGLTLTFAADDDLPPVRGDIHQLTQVMTNLIVNALNYTPQGWVRVTMTAKDGQACVRVADSGQGIAPADLPHIFDRFYRGRHARQRDIPGTGLGLAIVKEIMELHQGSITVDSQVDEGTTFRVDLPVSL